MLIVTSRRRSPSTVNFCTCSRSLSMSASDRSLTFAVPLMPAATQIALARGRPMPYTAVSASSACWWLGMLTPAIRAMIYLYRFKSRSSALPLLVPRVRADDAHDAVAPDDLAVAADFLHRSQNLHCPTSPVYFARKMTRARVRSYGV